MKPPIPTHARGIMLVLLLLLAVLQTTCAQKVAGASDTCVHRSVSGMSW